MPETRSKRGAWALAGILLTWVALAFWIAPLVIASAHGGDVGFLHRILTAVADRPLDSYLRYWRIFAWITTAGLALFVLARLPITGDRVRGGLSGEPRVSSIGLVGLSLWFGSIAGLIEALHLTAWFFIERSPSRPFDWEFVWMAPLAAAAAYVVLGLAFRGIALLLPRSADGRRHLSLAPVVAVFAAIAAYSVLGAPRLRMAGWAAAVLALGIGTVAARSAAASPARFRAFVRRSTPALVATVIGLIGMGVWNLPALQERRRIADLPESARGAPNVILIILDTVRAKSLSLYGYEKPTTPHLERRAAEGVVFDRAFSTAPWTLPSHASLFTGRWAHEHSADYGSRLDRTHGTLAEALSRRGYRTAGFTANTVNASAATGLARGFARYEDHHIGWGKFLRRSFLSRTIVGAIPLDKSGWRMGGKSATENTNDVVRWVDGLEGERPFFLFVNYFDAHDPYPSPPAFRRRFPAETPPLLQPRPNVTREEAAGTAALYDAAIAYVDEEVDRLLGELEGRGLLENTVLIIASDHGEAMGEHGLLFHGNHVYPSVIQVPLVVIAPGRAPAGVRVPATTSLRDVGATILDLVTGGEPPTFPGRSLATLWADPGEDGGPVLAQISPSWNTRWQEGILRTIVQGRYQALRHPDGARELYDLDVDPGAEHDLSESADYADVLADLDARLDSLVGGAPRSGG